MQCCLREIWLLLALNNIHLFARHICGKTNMLADSLSRYHLADTYAAYVEHAGMLLKRGTGSGERGAGNGERKSGNELSAETSIKSNMADD